MSLTALEPFEKKSIHSFRFKLVYAKCFTFQ